MHDSDCDYSHGGHYDDECDYEHSYLHADHTRAQAQRAANKHVQANFGKDHPFLALFLARRVNKELKKERRVLKRQEREFKQAQRVQALATLQRQREADELLSEDADEAALQLDGDTDEAALQSAKTVRETASQPVNNVHATISGRLTTPTKKTSRVDGKSLRTVTDMPLLAGMDVSSLATAAVPPLVSSAVLSLTATDAPSLIATEVSSLADALPALDTKDVSLTSNSWHDLPEFRE